MTKDHDRSKASFKLDLIKTANADPSLKPADFKLLVAYAEVMEWPSGRTWLATSLALALTGLSERQFRTSRDRLRGQDGGRRYLDVARRGGRIAAYRLINPWLDDAKAHIEAMVEYHKGVERSRKAMSRMKKPASQSSDLSRQILPGQNPDCPGRICRPVPAEFAAYNPTRITPRKKGGREESPLGPNVVPFISKRKAS
jgi:hypothetical protein